MQRYDTYKPSSVKWLGEIPSHWEVKRFKHFGTFSKGKLPKNNNLDGMGFPIIGASEMNGKEPSVFTEDINVPHCLPYDILILWDGANAGLVANNKKGVVASTAVKYTCFDDSINNRYLFYLIKNYQRYYKDKVSGTTIPHMNIAFINDTPLLVPKYAEQTAIASYLDTATAKIDAAIAQQQKMIDLLNERKQIIINRAVTKGLNPNAKMKDSGVEWIGEVPEGWEVKKLGYCIDILPGYAFPSQDFVENGIKLLRGINVSPEKIRWEESVYWNKTIDDTLKKYLLEENDLVLGLDRPWIGSGTRVAIVKKEDLPCLLVQRVCRIHPTNMMSINYIYYLLSNNLFYNALAVDTTGVSVPHISTEQIKKVVIPIPKLSEQNAIVEYIEMHIASINKAIQAANNQISLLQERKQIIINEVVTGKVKVI